MWGCGKALSTCPTPSPAHTWPHTSQKSRPLRTYIHTSLPNTLLHAASDITHCDRLQSLTQTLSLSHPCPCNVTLLFPSPRGGPQVSSLWNWSYDLLWSTCNRHDDAPLWNPSVKRPCMLLFPPLEFSHPITLAGQLKNLLGRPSQTSWF